MRTFFNKVYAFHFHILYRSQLSVNVRLDAQTARMK
jgi:hypothetical protein